MTDHHAVKRGEATVLVGPKFTETGMKSRGHVALLLTYTLFLSTYIRNTVEMQLCSCLVIGFQISR